MVDGCVRAVVGRELVVETTLDSGGSSELLDEPAMQAEANTARDVNTSGLRLLILRS